VIVQFGSVALKVSPGGLAWEHWVIALVLGLIILLWDFLLKLIPDKFCPKFGQKKKNPLVDEEHNILSLRRGRSESFALRSMSNLSQFKGQGSFLR